MKSKKEILLALLLGVALPSLLLRIAGKQNQAHDQIDVHSVVIVNGDVTERMDIEEYLVGVLLAEMPADFEDEALKAQAIAARTFALHRTMHGSKHPDANVCTSAICCQGYISPDAHIESGGTSVCEQKMRDAVNATKGLALFYEGNIIEATYFSSSGGRTEDAKAVWGVSVPYLMSVESIEGDTAFIKETEKEEFCVALGIPPGEVYIERPTYTVGGGIERVCINGQTYSGMQLRQKLGLRSTRISFYVGKDTVQISTTGHGHRVGMSQYGADAMAAQGYNYEEILTHYYTGAAIRPFSVSEN